MSCTSRTLCLLALWAVLPAALLASQSEVWRVAEPGWKYSFPRDHGPHREFKTEWWYATGNLVDDHGNDYGFQLTFFRQGIHPGSKPEGSSRFRVTELPFAHFAFTDVQGHSFKFFQQSSRGVFGEAGFGVPPGRIAWMNDWVLEQDGEGKLHLKASGEGRSADLILSQTRETMIHGTNGISPKSSKPDHASHYYSMTRLKAEGAVCIDNKSHAVLGTVWFDHEWASNSLASDEKGWDWFGLHLSNGGDLMIFRIRDTKGMEVFSSGTLRESNGVTHDIKDLKFTPIGAWRSPHTGGFYPASWRVSSPSRKLELSLEPKLADQELVLAPFAYWEGAVKGSGVSKDRAVQAEGYIEMTGYGGTILGLSK